MNAFLLGEDVPAAWDNWDIDEDQALKMQRQSVLLSREVAADGPLEFRLRSRWRIERSSELRQDLVLRTGSPMVTFETEIDWREKHALLKAAFPTSLNPPFARHEIQFGHIERPVNRNNTYETVKFEVCQHKWSYEGLSKRWLVAQEYCAGHSRREAAAAAGVDVHTAGRHYAAFERALAGYVRRALKQGRAWKFVAIRSPGRIAAERDSSPRQRLRLAARLCLDGLHFRRRVELLYELVFSPLVLRNIRTGRKAPRQ